MTLLDESATREALARALHPLGLGPNAFQLIGTHPSYSALHFSLDRANIRCGDATLPSGKGEPAFHVREVTAAAREATIEGVPFSLQGRAGDAVFHAVTDATGNTRALPMQWAEGTLELRITIAAIESALLTAARKAAAEHGAELQSVTIELHGESPCAVRLRAVATAKAMLFTARLTLSGKIILDESLTLTLSETSCTGDGMIANLAASQLRPMLDRAAMTQFALRDWLPSLRQVTLAVQDGALVIRASA